MSADLPLETDEEIEFDPVCGERVDLDEAETHSLALEFEGRSYAFCSPACRERFEHEPTRYAVAGRASP